jgi:exosortase D (VPLPA-CTERM-specific)
MTTHHIETNTNLPGKSVGRGSWLGPAVYVAVFLATIAFFWQGIESLFIAWQRPEYSHGYIIPFIALFIALKRLTWEDVNRPRNGIWFGLGLLGFGLLAGMFGRLSAIPDISTYGMLLVIAGLAVCTWGLSFASKLWPAWAYLAFMLPLPNFIYWPLSIKLQFLSSEIGVALIKLIGVPVYLDGNIIDLGDYQLQVAEACSGLRYLFPLMSFGFLFSVLYRGPAWHKVLIFLASIPITILMNSVRIAAIGFLVNRYGIAQAEGFLHFFEGWIVFAVCIALLFSLAIILQRFTPNPQSLTAVLDLESEGLLGKFGRFVDVALTKSILVALVLTATAAVLSQTALQPKRVFPDRTALEQYPSTLGTWSGKRSYLEYDIERVLGADDYLMADYSQSAARPSVNFLVSYYKSQNEGSGIHSPEVCIPGGGWEVSKWEQTPVTIKSQANRTFNVNRAIIQKGLQRQLVYYWFEQRGRQLTNDYLAKGYTVYDSITKGRSDGALIRVVTPMLVGESVAAASARLADFLELALQPLPSFVPP